MKFIIEKKSNSIFIVTDCGTIFKTWNEKDFTERKLKNAIRKIEKECYVKPVFINTL